MSARQVDSQQLPKLLKQLEHGLDSAFTVMSSLAGISQGVAGVLRTLERRYDTVIEADAAVTAGRTATVEASLVDEDRHKIRAVPGLVRRITIVGQGGIGKTRLAIATAERQTKIGHYPQGVFFVAMAPLDEVSSKQY